MAVTQAGIIVPFSCHNKNKGYLNNDWALYIILFIKFNIIMLYNAHFLCWIQQDVSYKKNVMQAKYEFNVNHFPI